MTSQSFSVRLSEEDAASIAALQKQITLLKQTNEREKVWELSARASHIINRSTLHFIESDEFDSDEVLIFTDVPRSFEQVNMDNKGLHLELLLIADSPLAREITEVLKRHGEDGSVI